MVDPTDSHPDQTTEIGRLGRKIEELELVLGTLVSLLIRKEVIGDEEFVAHIQRTRTMRESSAQNADSNSSATILES